MNTRVKSLGKRRGEVTLLAALVAGVLLTRFEHFGSALSLPDATLAVFFLAGLWLTSPWVMVPLLLAAGLADQLAFAQGVSNWCVTAAYGFLIPAYACLWAAGQRCRHQQPRFPFAEVSLWAWLIGACLAAFFISSFSFFVFSRYFPAMSAVEYAIAMPKYVAPYVGWTVLYVIVGLAIAEGVRRIARRRAVAVAP